MTKIVWGFWLVGTLSTAFLLNLSRSFEVRWVRVYLGILGAFMFVWTTAVTVISLLALGGDL